VIADAIEHTKHTALGGEILFITHLMLLPYIRTFVEGWIGT